MLPVNGRPSRTSREGETNSFREKIPFALLVPASLVLVALAFAYVSTKPLAKHGESPVSASPNQNLSPASVPANRKRNLALQPEAFNLSRKTGQRFRSDRDSSIMIGLLTVGDQKQPLRIQRKQSDDGEKVEISLAGGPALTWSSVEGLSSPGARATSANRSLIERLVFDSPDQFVLAQLRGASYYTVGRNVRPDNAGDGYTGPIWTVIRVDDPEPDSQKKPQSSWRLYYLNGNTGLVDRVVSEAQGERVEAAFFDWVDHAGEKTPSHIVWSIHGRTIMEFHLTTFAQNSQP